VVRRCDGGGLVSHRRAGQRPASRPEPICRGPAEDGHGKSGIGLPGFRRCGAAASLASFGRMPCGRGGCRARLPRHRPQPVPAVTSPGAARRELVAAVGIAPDTPIAGRRSQSPDLPRIVRVGPSSLNGASHPRFARTRLRRAVDPGADPAGLTARARPEAQRHERAANLSGELGSRLGRTGQKRHGAKDRRCRSRGESAYWSYISSALRVVSLVSRCAKRRTSETKPTMPKARRATAMMFVHHMLTTAISRYILLSPEQRAVHRVVDHTWSNEVACRPLTQLGHLAANCLRNREPG
jgi:hypothetical protein